MLSVRLFVRPSVTLVDQDHIGRKSWKLIARTISPTPSLFVAQRPSTYSQGEHVEILRRLQVGCGKVVCWSTKAAISLKRVKIDEKLLWRAYRNSPTLFRTVPKTVIAIISGTAKATDCKFDRYIHRVCPNKNPLKTWEKRERGPIQGLPNFLSTLLSQE